MALIGRNRSIVITSWEDLAEQIESSGLVWWKLYEGHTVKNNNHKHLDQSTMVEGLEMADSLRQLEAVMLRLGGGDGLIRLYNKPNIGTGYTEYKFSIFVENKRFISSPSMLPTTQTGMGINGTGAQLGMLSLQRDFVEQLHQKELAILELKHSYEKEKTEERLEALEYELKNGTTMQKLLNTCSEFIKENPSIIGAVLTNLMGGKSGGGQVAISGLPNNQQQKQTVSNMSQPTTGTQPKEVDAEAWNARMQNVLQRLQGTVNNKYGKKWDVLDMLEAQADFLEKKTSMGKMVLGGLEDYMPKNQNEA